VRQIVLTRAAEYNTITPALRDDLARAIDDADADHEVNVILLRAEGPAFCAGYGLDWSTAAQADESKRIAGGGRVWDSVGDYRMMKTFVDTYMKLWYAQKPTIAAVHGWCIAGGTDMVLCADMIVAAESASFGYPPSRVWGTPTTAMWVYRMGIERAKRYLLTGDEIPARKAAELGLVLEVVPDGELQSHALAAGEANGARAPLAARDAEAPLQPDREHMGMATTRLIGTPLRRGGAPHPGRSRLRASRRRGGISPGRARARRPVR
jgi:enoyl-CoA hydratase